MSIFLHLFCFFLYYISFTLYSDNSLVNYHPTFSYHLCPHLFFHHHRVALSHPQGTSSSYFCPLSFLCYCFLDPDFCKLW
ncbi:hypothetical protein F4703DRAFT_1823732 [Phycomyces blakesleeanus]